MRVYLSLLFWLCVQLNSYCALLPERDLKIVGNKKPLACIVVPENIDNRFKEAAECLSDYICKSTGAKLKIQSWKSEDLINIHIGNNSYNSDCNISFSDPEEFAIFFPDNKNIVLAGGSPAGVEYAVYEFLERYIGVRWLFPGELGEYVHVCDDVNVPRETVRQCPAFLLRHFFCINEESQRIWVQKMRINCSERLQFHHNLGNIFTATLFGKEHPEFFPFRDGKRFIPQPGTYSWQPCFSAKGSAGAVAERICQYFSEHSEAVSYSLGVNDSAGDCCCEQCLLKIPGEKNEIGQVNYSQLYYSWANEVIEKVREKYPDKYFGCLAYNSVFSPPEGIKLNNHFVPMVTLESYQWVDENVKNKIKNINHKWQKSADIFGGYDYFYGRPYKIPRIWFHTMADYLCYIHEHNVKYYTAEVPQKFDWPEGPQLYLAAKLLWNPHLDTDVILSEWYNLTVGEKAAPYMKQYFEYLEFLWCFRVPKTSWFFLDAEKIYLDFNSDGYLEATNENDIAECDKILQMMLANPGTPKQEQRAKHYYNTFKTWSANVSEYLQRKVVDTIELIPENSFEKITNFWNMRSEYIIHDDQGNSFHSPKNLYVILVSGYMNANDIIHMLTDEELEIKLKVKGSGGPLFGACLQGFDENRKPVTQKHLFWNVTIREQMISLRQQVKWNDLLKNQNLGKLKYFRVIFYNISFKDKPDSQIFIKDISLTVKKYKSHERTNCELIKNCDFASGADYWSTEGKIIAENGKNILRTSKNDYIILTQKQDFQEDFIGYFSLQKFSTWQLKVNARGKNNPRIGMIIQEVRPSGLTGGQKNIFWNVSLNNETTEIKQEINMDFIARGTDCIGLKIILYRCDLKNNPLGQIDIEQVSLMPINTKSDKK